MAWLSIRPSLSTKFTTISTSALYSIRTRQAPSWQKKDLSRQRANLTRDRNR